MQELLTRMARRTSANPPALERSGTRERILAVAVDQFARHGFDGCTIRDLATAVGIRAPGIYSHFASKEAILSEAMIRALNDFLGYIAAPSSAGNPRDELRETVHRHVLYQLEHLRVTRANDLLLNSEAIRRFLPTEDRELLLDVQRAYFRLVRARVAAVVGEHFAIDLTATSFAIITMCDGVTSWYRPNGRLTPRDIADQHWNLVRGMLRIA